MRISICIVAAMTSIGAQGPTPQTIAFNRVFPSAGQIGLFIAAADGSGERALLSTPNVDYDPVWSPDGASIVFTSERAGSADLFRVNSDGGEPERLTDNSAYDDQAAFSPDGKQVVFVSTRGGGTADLWLLDLQTKRAKPLTSGPGGDFRPSWSPDGTWIAFSSDRESTLPFAYGRWEHLHLVDVYVVRPDGSSLRRITKHGDFCGSPKWLPNGKHVIAYCMTAEQTLANRRPAPVPGSETRLVSIDVATGAVSDVAAGAGVKMNPSPLSGGDVGYIRKDAGDTGAGVYYTSGRRGPSGDMRAASWSPDGKRVVFHRRLTVPRPAWTPTYSRDPRYQLTMTGGLLPSFSPSGDRYVTTRAALLIATTGADRLDVLYEDKNRNVLGPTWSPRGDLVIFCVGEFNAFFNGFNGLFLKPEDRVEGGAQVAIIKPDGSGFREVTAGPNNNGFPSMAPDGKRFVYRTFGPEGDGLRIMDLETKAVTKLTEGYDNFPLWSPRGESIMFSRQADGDYEIYTIKSDGTSLKRLTSSRGNDAHMAWSPDGEYIAFATTRMGFKDEVTYTDAPQPYGELFVMRSDGTGLQQLTDNQWEDGAPAWQPTAARAATSPASATQDKPPAVSPAGAQSSTAAGLADAFAHAWNTHDVQALGELYAADADWVMVSGVRHKGREAIQGALAQEHATWARASTLRPTDVVARDIDPDHAIVMLSWEITVADGNGTATLRGNTLIVARKERGRWLIVSGQTARVPLPASAGGEHVPVISPAKAPAGSDARPVRWVNVSAPGVGVMLAAIARPTGDGPFPTAIILHGTHGFAQEYVQLAQDLAQGGMLAVAACWFTGGGGTGARFITPVGCPEAPPRPEASSPEAMKIVDMLVQAVRALPDVRPDRIALVGQSRGGGAAVHYALSADRVQAVVLNSTGYPNDLVDRAADVRAPILVLHGTADNPADGGSAITNVHMARNFEAALRRAGKPVDAFYYEGGRHNGMVADSTQYQDTVRRITAFLRRHLGN